MARLRRENRRLVARNGRMAASVLHFRLDSGARHAMAATPRVRHHPVASCNRVEVPPLTPAPIKREVHVRLEGTARAFCDFV